MRSKLRNLVQRKTSFLFIFYVLLSFFLMNFNDAFTLRGMRIVILQLIAAVHAVENQLVYVKSLSAENKNLRKKVLDLALTKQRLQEALIENVRLRRMLQFKSKSKYQLIVGNVIGLGQERTVHSLILDVGLEDGVKKNMPVVTDAGLVGKILHADPHQSTVQILMDRNAMVSARLQMSRQVGVIGWSGNFWLDLNYIPKDVPVESGEQVLTSGLSQIYPPGIKIGVVGEAKADDYKLFQQIRVKNAVDFNNLEEVFVMVTPDSMRNPGVVGE